jgi:hypothetical protein
MDNIPLLSLTLAWPFDILSHWHLRMDTRPYDGRQNPDDR